MSSTRARYATASAIAIVLATFGGVRAQVIPVPGSSKVGLKDLEKTDTFKKLKDGLKTIKDINDKGDTYYKDIEKLSSEDDQYDPQDLPGSPDLPSLCKDSWKCKDCYTKPYADLQSTRIRFEKLRRLNRVTKNMIRDSLSFGDAAASAAGSAGGGIAGLAWDREKTKIRANEADFNRVYDAKYEELLATLKTNLQGIAVCEAQIFGNEAWYDRFGFFYVNFMAEAYKRPD